MAQDRGYLQHGKAGESMRTERVAVKPRSWPNAGEWQAFYEGRWRAVHVSLSRLWIVYQGERITITIEGV